MDESVYVVQLVRSVGPTSMPWNDLYPVVKKHLHGRSHLPIVVNSLFGNANIKFCDGGLGKYRYLESGLFKAIAHLIRIQRRGAKRKHNLLIHVHNPSLALVAAITKFIHPTTKIVANLHNEWAFYKLHQRISMGLLSHICSHFVTVSNSIRKSLPKNTLKRLEKSKRISTIANGINPNRLMSYINAGKRPNTAVVVARMVPQKNCLFILKILKNTPLIERLIWIGSGPQNKMLAEAVKELSIEDKVEFLGVVSRETVYQTLGRSSIYIAASIWEGIGVANIEAAMLGCRPFLSSINPHMEIADNLELTTFSLRATENWSKGITEYLNSPESKKSNDLKKIQNSVELYYDFGKNGMQYIDIYQDISKSLCAKL